MTFTDDPSISERNLNSQRYLESEVRTASPARLRLMLIERAVDVARKLANSWRDGEELGPNEHSLNLLGLLTELLNGVTGGKTESDSQVCRQVADLYVFLTQHLLAAESASCVSSIDEIATVLQTEAETWRAVCAAENAKGTNRGERAANPSGGLNLEG